MINDDFKNDTDSAIESDTSDDSITEQLDQIGKLNLPLRLNSLSSYLPEYFTKRNFDLGSLELPNLELPSFDYKNKLPDFATEFNKFLNNYKSNGDQYKLFNTMKTVVSTRIQMNNVLNDLNLGISLSSAVNRLQPLKDVIQDMIALPVEEEGFEDDFYDGRHIDTEPKGITSIIAEEEVYLNDFVIPEEDLSENQRDHNNSHHSRKRQKKSKRNATSQESSRNSSDLDIEGLTLDETRQLTNMDSLEDFYEEDLLRDKIKRIQGLDNIGQHLKNKLVTRLMMGNYYKYVNEKLGSNTHAHDDLELTYKLGSDMELSDEEREVSDEDEVILTEKDKGPSYYDKENSILGCQHYQRNVKIECPTCLKWFPCRFCHDEEIKDHKLTRNEIKHILCMFCTTPQEPTDEYCIECNKELSCYICFKCKLYDNDYNKDIYHCDKCGICRLGLGLDKDYFHCDNCNICLSVDLKDNHKCVDNTTHCNCPICNEYLFTSIQKVVFMKCGHLIHEVCYKELVQHSYKCPLCKKTVVNMDTQFRILDQEILQLPLPMPYKLWRCVINCNDCKGKSNVAYHLLGLKCKYCNSYNTNQIKLIKPEEEQDDEIRQPDSVDRMALIQTNLSNNFNIDRDYDADNNKSYTEMDSLDRDEEPNLDNDDTELNLVNIKQFTNRLINKPDNNEISYVAAIFQKYINNTLKSMENRNK